MSKLYGAKPRDEIDQLPVGTILRRIAYALRKRQGEWISTEDLMDVAYDFDQGSKEALKININVLRKRLPSYRIEGNRWHGRRLVPR